MYYIVHTQLTKFDWLLNRFPLPLHFHFVLCILLLVLWVSWATATVSLFHQNGCLWINFHLIVCISHWTFRRTCRIGKTANFEAVFLLYLAENMFVDNCLLFISISDNRASSIEQSSIGNWHLSIQYFILVVYVGSKADWWERKHMRICVFVFYKQWKFMWSVFNIINKWRMSICAKMRCNFLFCSSNMDVCVECYFQFPYKLNFDPVRQMHESQHRFWLCYYYHA